MGFEKLFDGGLPPFSKRYFMNSVVLDFILHETVGGEENVTSDTLINWFQ